MFRGMMRMNRITSGMLIFQERMERGLQFLLSEGNLDQTSMITTSLNVSLMHSTPLTSSLCRTISMMKGLQTQEQEKVPLMQTTTMYTENLKTKEKTREMWRRVIIQREPKQELEETDHPRSLKVVSQFLRQ